MWFVNLFIILVTAGALLWMGTDLRTEPDAPFCLSGGPQLDTLTFRLVVLRARAGHLPAATRQAILRSNETKQRAYRVHYPRQIKRDKYT
jgi:hypothetical protein